MDLTQSSTDPLLSEILKTHDAETRQVDLTHLVKVMESILLNVAPDAASRVTSSTTIDSMKDNLRKFEGMPQALEDIHSIYCEMSCNASGSVDATTMALLKRLKKYSWNAKVVLAIAAFASIIGEWSMLVNQRATNPIAQSVDLLKGQSLKLDLTVLNQLLKAMVGVVKTNFEFLVPPISKIPPDAPPMKEAIEYFPMATYKIFLSLVQIATILNKKEENIDMTMTIGRLASEVSQINTGLQQKLIVCRRVIVEQPPPPVTTPYQYVPMGGSQYVETLEVIMPQISIEELVKKIKLDMRIQLPEKLRKKNVLLLVSDLDISDDEIKVLNELYIKDDRSYEIAWLPIVDPLDYDKRRFSELTKLMKWSTNVIGPSQIGQTVAENIKKEWHFVKNPIALSVNVEGHVTCQNALPLLWTWGNLAFPFTYEIERTFWNKIDEENGWRLSLLLDKQIIPDISSWNGKFVCLFGGDKVQWIQDFTRVVKNATSLSGVASKFVYVGTSKGKGLSRNDLNIGPELDVQVIESQLQWQFWSRLESILFAKMQQGSTTKNSSVVREALKLLGYASGGESWAIFSMGSAPMVTANGAMALTIMSNHQNWKMDATYKGPSFLEALRDYYMARMKDPYDHGCIHVHLPVLGPIPGKAICPVCNKEMEIYYTYRCCI